MQHKNFTLPAGKDRSIETLRGVAVVLMVAGHVVGSQPDFAMQVPDNSPWRLIFWGFQDIRMPLFTVLSGWLYASRPITSAGQMPELFKAKARRLLIPLVVIGTLLFWTKLVTPGTNSKPELEHWWRPYVLGLDHLWFLQAIFLIFMVVGFIDAFGVLSSRRGWASVTIVTAVLFVITPDHWGVFGMTGATRLLPFFLFGYGLKRYQFGKATPSWGLAAGGILLVSYVPRIMDVYSVIDLPREADRSLAVIVGTASICLFFWYRKTLANNYLAWIGQFAFGIYLLHYFATSAARIGLRLLDLDANYAVFVGGMVAGVGLPILFQIATRGMPTVRLLILGEKRRRLTTSIDAETATSSRSIR